MGNTYEVWLFEFGHGYKNAYRGDWLLVALYIMWKKRKYPCVKLEIR